MKPSSNALRGCSSRVAAARRRSSPGISAALRRLVDQARKREPGKQRARTLREAASRFMTTMAGDLPDFEEASRALFAGDQRRFERLVRGWPSDIRKHALRWVREAARLERDETGTPNGGSAPGGDRESGDQ